MLGSRDVSRNAVNWYHAPMGLCCNSACKKCGTASRREGGHLLTLDQERERSVEELQLDEVIVFVAKLITFLVVCGFYNVANHCCCGSPPLRLLQQLFAQQLELTHSYT